MDEYMSSVRDLERRVQAVDRTRLPRGPEARRRLADETADLPSRVQHFQELIVLAFKLDVTRVITFSMGNGLSKRALPHLGIGDGHGQTHHSGDEKKIENVKKMDLWRMEQLARLLRALRSTRDPDGAPLLSSSAVLYMSEIGDGNRHDQYDKPMVIAGQLGGAIRTGRVLYFQRPTAPEDAFLDCSEASRTAAEPFPKGCTEAPQLADLYLGLLRAFGIHEQRFGETGTRALDLA
jgi:hypothetical protein